MYNEISKRNVRRDRRVLRVTKNVRGNAVKPRLAVSKTNKHLFVQLIDDEKQITLASVGTMSLGSQGAKGGKYAKKSKEAAKQIGMKIAELAKAQQIEKAVFDRRRFKFHGIVAEVANAARESGLQF